MIDVEVITLELANNMEQNLSDPASKIISNLKSLDCKCSCPYCLNQSCLFLDSQTIIGRGYASDDLDDSNENIEDSKIEEGGDDDKEVTDSPKLEEMNLKF